MGIKGAKATTAGAEFANALVPRFEGLGDVTKKGMFGGYGFFQAGKMFALVTSGAELFLKADDSNRARFSKANSPQHGKMPYFRVPDAVLENDKKLIEWAKDSVAVAHK